MERLEKGSGRRGSHSSYRISWNPPIGRVVAEIQEDLIAARTRHIRSGSGQKVRDTSAYSLIAMQLTNDDGSPDLLVATVDTSSRGSKGTSTRSDSAIANSKTLVQIVHQDRFAVDLTLPKDNARKSDQPEATYACEERIIGVTLL